MTSLFGYLICVRIIVAKSYGCRMKRGWVSIKVKVNSEKKFQIINKRKCDLKCISLKISVLCNMLFIFSLYMLCGGQMSVSISQKYSIKCFGIKVHSNIVIQLNDKQLHNHLYCHLLSWDKLSG